MFLFVSYFLFSLFCCFCPVANFWLKYWSLLIWCLIVVLLMRFSLVSGVEFTSHLCNDQLVFSKFRVNSLPSRRIQHETVTITINKIDYQNIPRATIKRNIKIMIIIIISIAPFLFFLPLVNTVPLIVSSFHFLNISSFLPFFLLMRWIYCSCCCCCTINLDLPL